MLCCSARPRRSTQIVDAASREPLVDPLAARRRGILLASVALLAVSPDALCVRLLRASFSADAPNATFIIVMWKSLALGFFNLASAMLLDGGSRRLIDGIVFLPGHSLLASAFQMVNQLGFSLSFQLTDPATALLLACPEFASHGRPRP